MCRNGEVKELDAVLTRHQLKMRGIPPNAKILEIGCGTGHSIEAFREAGYDYHGLELAPQITNSYAKQVGYHKLVHFYDGKSIPKEIVDYEFDVAIFRLCLHHFPEPIESLKAFVNQRVAKSIMIEETILPNKSRMS